MANISKNMTMQDRDNPFISIIIPCYNEEENINALYQALTKALNALGYQYELMFVNDGSKDKTLERLIELYEKNDKVKIIDFSRNFGKEIALSAGLDYAGGDAIIPIDADLQDPPRIIPELLEKYQEGYDVVNTVRSGRDSETFLKKITSKIFYKVINKIADIEIQENSGDFKLFSKNALEAIKGLRERKRFMKGIFAWIGFKSTVVYYDQAPRFAGKTKWNYLKLVDLAVDGITSFSAMPLRFAFILGIVVSLFAFFYTFYLIVDTLIFDNLVGGYHSIMVAILFLGGVQLMTIGILGEYIGRINEDVKQRPLYIIRKIWKKEK